MNSFLSYPGCHKFWSALTEFFQIIDKGRIWWYNTLEDNKGIILDILRPGNITSGSVLINTNLVVPKGGNNEPVLTVKRTEWRKSVDYFGLSIDTDPSRVDKKNVYFFILGIWQALNL